eukprot:scaffold88503_cov21-Phaeocystis_antarctica.AAC.1
MARIGTLGARGRCYHPMGAARAPPGGLGQTQALTISKGAGPHAHVAPYGRRWRLVQRLNSDLLRPGKVVPGVGGGMGCINSGGEVDHGG